MGTFGPGPFENDTALDFLTEANTTSDIRAALLAVVPPTNEGPDVTAAERAIAAAEIVAIAMGRGAANHLPETLQALDLSDLEEAAREAVSTVMMGGELLVLWAEADAGAFNAAMTDLIQRLDRNVPYAPETWADSEEPVPVAPVCCFCHAAIENEPPVELSVRLRHDIYNDLNRLMTAHLACLNARLDPRHFIQNWTFAP